MCPGVRFRSGVGRGAGGGVLRSLTRAFLPAFPYQVPGQQALLSLGGSRALVPEFPGDASTACPGIPA